MKFYLRLRPKKNNNASTNSYVETMTLAFSDTCKDKGYWPEMAKEAAELQSACS